MIITVTLNPLLERRLTFDKVQLGEDHRNGKEILAAGGKGINVSRELNCLGLDNLSYTFLGGTNGKILKEVLSSEGIKFASVKIKEESRDASIIIDNSHRTVTTFFRENSIVSADEAQEFKNRLEKMIENCEIIVFAGSSPCKETDCIFPYGIKLANKYGKISVCDTYGSHLNECYDSVPTVVHNNVSEVEKSIGLDLTSDNDKSEFLNSLYKKGIKQVYLTDGNRPAFASTFEYKYKIENPVIQPYDVTGSGDCFVAGIVYSWHNNLTFEDGLTTAAALGSANASRYDVCNVKMSEAEQLKPKVKISPYGKKMKTVDVSPHTIL